MPTVRKIVRKIQPRETHAPEPRPSMVVQRAPVDPRLAQAVWHVWVEGSEPIGPVSVDQIARGIRAGKVPSHASIQKVGDLFACDVLDEPDVIAALKHL